MPGARLSGQRLTILSTFNSPSMLQVAISSLSPLLFEVVHRKLVKGVGFGERPVYKSLLF